ncbi:hypothetical protein E2562_008725 [Oryza meyeriana var. granulata]|uniref:Uncharacterized protein n=1 Tax=Oryza meyeriana var. granulata TaxID=110450 RepID=A0A6G1F5T8_9ORYZ|nr:hypothetical protein E2562_008725 [Oryza meyeriana var. granulata]
MLSRLAHPHLPCLLSSTETPDLLAWVVPFYRGRRACWNAGCCCFACSRGGVVVARKRMLLCVPTTARAPWEMAAEVAAAAALGADVAELRLDRRPPLRLD